MSTKAKPNLRSMGVEEFARRLKHETESDEKNFALFLGAGCSVSSGIPAAADLVKNHWLPRLHRFKAPERTDMEKWASEIFKGYRPEKAAQFYGPLIDELFQTPEHRQREIEDLCDGRTPSFGYAVLAQLIARHGSHFNMVLTTNFDDLVSDALYLYTETKPLVIHHESLATYIRPTRTRPLVVKLHGDHRLSPKNTVLETKEVEREIRRHTEMVLHDRGILFMGYGGYDAGILGLLNDLPPSALPFGAYWVHPKEPQGEIRKWLLARQGFWVQSGWFDEVMLLFLKELDLPHPDEKRFLRIFQDYHQKFKELSSAIEAKPPGEPGTETLKRALSDAVDRLPHYWKVVNEAARLHRLGDTEKAEEFYRKGVKEYPDCAPLLGNYAVFLKNIRKDYHAAKYYYKKALEADPKNASHLGNYALFLTDVRKDHDAAEHFYKKALEADPKKASHLGNYANFLMEIRRDLDASEQYYKKALEADPDHSNNLANYGGFLLAKGSSQGLELLKRAFDGLKNDFLPSVELECAFYRFLHASEDERCDGFHLVRKLLADGVRSPNWDFARNIARAKADKHPESPWLDKLAAVINDKAAPKALDEWPAWRDATPIGKPS